jgi:UDP-N-acetylmuramoyl-L-alanyl-D-glutamate--2,6-diaminopimelate ligase
MAAAAAVEARGPVDTTEVHAVEQDTAHVVPGTLFCCVPGTRVDGHDLAPVAIERGASSLLCERILPVAVAQLRVADVRRALGPVASHFHGTPSRALTVVGVTGTNGKTTTAHLVRACLEAAGMPTGVIGTMTGERTTPEASDLQRTLARFVSDGKGAGVMEVSSVGLARHRVDGTWFAAGIFTNLSPDELTIHGSVEAYFEAKASLFRADRCGVGIVNGDDEWGQRILATRPVRLAAFGRRDAEVVAHDRSSSTFVWRGQRIMLPMPGEFNVMNALAAATAAREIGVDEKVIAGALSSVGTLAGHTTDIDAGQPFRVVVDFAHSGGALAAVLEAVRREAPAGAKVRVVFGCGGDRDASRRPIMGRAAAEHADVVIVTSDNPRREEPAAIISQIVAGVDDVGGAAMLHVEPDRRAAITLALADAAPGDVVVIAGKGHETGQIVGDETLPFDDREVAREALTGLRHPGVRDGAP